MAVPFVLAGMSVRDSDLPINSKTAFYATIPSRYETRSYWPNGDLATDNT
jgi:hypothetical protein